MSTLPAPLACRPAEPAAAGATDAGPTPRAFLAGCARLLLVPAAGLAAVLTGWTLAAPAVGPGWPAAVTVAAGWSLVAAAWLRHRGWSSAVAHLTAWVAPAALLVPMAPLGWLSPSGLVLWGPASGVFAIALAALHEPGLAVRPTRTGQTR
jgi:hypothetical protein